jgi:organic radical activating enzyme
MHLGTGLVHSCHHPKAHVIPLEELENNPAALFNTSQLKTARKQMLTGEKPSECDYCWRVEDRNSPSDRYFKSLENWALSTHDMVLENGHEIDYYPTYLEVDFSNVCNFNCIYCGPEYSSIWVEDLKRNGPVKVLEHTSKVQWIQGWQDLDSITYKNREHNPYVEAFWKWWPNLKNDLKIFRITGGEPLMTANTFKLLDMLKKDGNPELFLQINTNLGVTTRKVEDFCSRVQELIEKKHVKNIRVFTSLECTGKQAEYIRRGLNYNLFLQNINTVLETIPTAYVSFMTTYNVLTVPYFKDFLQLIVELREKWGERILIDIPHLKEPPHWTMNILPKEFGRYIDSDVEYMRENGFQDFEIRKMERIREYFYNDTHNVTEEYRLNARKDFAKFFPEYDRRSNSNLADTFPEFTEFLEWCKEL